MKKIIILTTFLCVAMLSQPACASGTSLKDAVRNKQDSTVRSTNGNCVRTKWDGGGDVCGAPAPKSVEAPAPAPYVPPAPKKPAVRTVVQEEQRTIYFDFDKDAITSESAKKLQSLATLFKNANDIQKVSIVGFADKMGSNRHNQKLSERRARAVEQYLHEAHYMNTALAKLRAVGAREAQAQCANKKTRAQKIACQASDRKVMLEIVYSKDVVGQ